MAAKEKLQSTATMAKLFNLSDRRIQQLAKEGVIDGKKEKGNLVFDLYPTVQKYVAYLNSKINNKDARTKKTEEDKLTAEADYKRAKADMAELQLQELKGQMHRAEDVEAITTVLVFSIRSMILALPGRLAVDVAGVSTAPEASEIIKRECHQILNELTNYVYNPEEYAKRVREREGWSDTPKDEDDEQ